MEHLFQWMSFTLGCFLIQALLLPSHNHTSFDHNPKVIYSPQVHQEEKRHGFGISIFSQTRPDGEGFA